MFLLYRSINARVTPLSLSLSLSCTTGLSTSAQFGSLMQEWVCYACREVHSLCEVKATMNKRTYLQIRCSHFIVYLQNRYSLRPLLRIHEHQVNIYTIHELQNTIHVSEHSRAWVRERERRMNYAMPCLYEVMRPNAFHLYTARRTPISKLVPSSRVPEPGNRLRNERVGWFGNPREVWMCLLQFYHVNESSELCVDSGTLMQANW